MATHHTKHKTKISSGFAILELPLALILLGIGSIGFYLVLRWCRLEGFDWVSTILLSLIGGTLAIVIVAYAVLGAIRLIDIVRDSDNKG